LIPNVTPYIQLIKELLLTEMKGNSEVIIYSKKRVYLKAK